MVGLNRNLEWRPEEITKAVCCARPGPQVLGAMPMGIVRQVCEWKVREWPASTTQLSLFLASTFNSRTGHSRRLARQCSTPTEHITLLPPGGFNGTFLRWAPMLVQPNIGRIKNLKSSFWSWNGIPVSVRSRGRNSNSKLQAQT